MPIVTQSADGKKHEFPDGTEPSVVDRVMKEYAQSQPQSQSQTAASPEAAERPWYEKMAHGFAAPLVGLDMLASQLEQYLVPGETAKSDIAAAEREKTEFQKGSTPGFSAWEMAGGLLNPLYYAGGPVRGAGLLSNVGRSALAGGKAGLIQPRDAENYWGNAAVGTAAGAAVGGAVGAAVQPLAGAIATNNPAAVDRYIIEKFRQGIKPGRQKGDTLATQYDNNIISGVGSVLDNKANLMLTDHAGVVTQGESPKSVHQLREAINQTEGELFKRYDYMTRTAEGQIWIDMHTVADKIENDIVNNPVKQTFSPEVIRHAQRLAKSLRDRDLLSPLQAQEAIRDLNAKLSAFYSNQTRKGVGLSQVDALAAHQIREELNHAIEVTVAPGYQGLKNEYGALRALENDVVNQAMRELAKPGGGLVHGVGDIAAAHSVITGILHGNPATAIGGAGLKMYTMVNEWLRSPNRAVRRLFEVAEQARGLPPGPLQQGATDAAMLAPTAGAVGALQLGETGR